MSLEEDKSLPVNEVDVYHQLSKGWQEMIDTYFSDKEKSESHLKAYLKTFGLSAEEIDAVYEYKTNKKIAKKMIKMAINTALASGNRIPNTKF